jgi:hypothetical protein
MVKGTPDYSEVWDKDSWAKGFKSLALVGGGEDDAEFIAHARTDLPDALDEIARLTADLAAMTAERDAAVRDMRIMRTCQICKHKPEGYLSLHGACDYCDDEDNWEWRGPVAENKEGV